MERMRLDEKLRALCARRRITPTELGREAGGIPKTTMYNWSNGISRPDLDSALKLARYFGVSLDYLADDKLDEPPPPDLTADELSVVEQLRALGLSRAEAIRALASAYSGRPSPPPAPSRRIETPAEIRESGAKEEPSRKGRRA